MAYLHNPEHCPTCRDSQTDVIDSRLFRGYRRRRYECLTCARRWSTYESCLPLKRLRKPLYVLIDGKVYEAFLT